MNEKRIVKPWQAGLMLLVGIAVIIAGLLVMKLNNRIVLALDGVIMCLMAWCFGIPYAELQQGIKDTVSSMIVAILILLSVGVLVGVWMASGTVPVMIYYGMKVLTPGLFLPVVCILCTLMSTMAGTSWGTLATVGVACMGVAQGLGVPLPAAAGAVYTGAFFGDKVSPLSDSPVITATVCDVPLLEGIRHALLSTGPAYLISLVFFFIYGLRYADGTVGGMVKDLYPEYHLDRKNLMRTLLDTGTGLAPMVSWSTTGSYTAMTLGVGNLAFLPYAPMLWLSIVFSIIFAVTGIATAKAKED